MGASVLPGQREVRAGALTCCGGAAPLDLPRDPTAPPRSCLEAEMQMIIAGVFMIALSLGIAVFAPTRPDRRGARRRP
ncbi:hypothetical protein GCM10010468_49880 [Actinocorallia longicatena]|uniref:Uncharacterized protein n=1 Tax=Actinocorallia longicatena TaxID=111803 RepID=A0ABP6QEL7_9ACTN